MNGSGCKTCPAKDECRAQLYRGEMCKDNRAKHGLGDPRTNAERIRAMSDEELAVELGVKQCPDATKWQLCDGDCERCWLEWLQQPAEV